MKNYDIVLASIPKSDYRTPLISPFLLKSALQENGFQCKAVDWNRDFYERTKDPKLFSRNELTFNKKEDFDVIWNKTLKDICLVWIKELKSYNPTWFGASFLSHRNVHFGKKLLEIMRNEIPNIKIVIGGFIVGEEKIGPNFLNSGLIDYFVDGEGEDAIINLLKGNYNFPGINKAGTGIPVNLDPGYIPDYKDVSHYKYSFYSTYSSRGCINNCKFCTENFYLKRHRVRKAERVVEEMEVISNISGNRIFSFVDSLINGNPKEFRKLIFLLKNKKFKWSGSFLITKWLNEKDFKNAAESGLNNISVGVESGSERIRMEMGKGFSDTDLYNCVEFATKNGISFSPNIIVGWPTETEEDFNKTLEFITYLSKLKNVGRINPGTTLRLGSKSKAYIDYNMKTDKNGHWVFNNNNYKLRKDRWFRLVTHCENLGLPTKRHWRRVEDIYNEMSR